MSGTGTPSSIALQRTASAFAFCSVASSTSSTTSRGMKQTPVSSATTRSPAALHDRADLALALAGLGRDAAHVRDVGHALDHQHVAFLREVVCFELRHSVDVLARPFDRVDTLEDAAARSAPASTFPKSGRFNHAIFA
jgi:hypothetical protein